MMGITQTGKKVVIIGGGTGSPASIRASLFCGYQTTSIVAMADDGGSSGLLRSHTGKLPPGDIRKCLVAMAEDQQDPWVRAFRQRYQYLNNHTLGNLILTALDDVTDSLPQAIALCERLLRVRGHVLPSTLDSVQMAGITRDGTNIVGQSSLCASPTALANVTLLGSNLQAYSPVLSALLEADLIVIGPGSLFTSLLAALLVPGMIAALKASPATVLYVAPITDNQGETWGLSALELVETLFAHSLEDCIDAVIVNHRVSSVEQNDGAVTAVFKAIPPTGLSVLPESVSSVRYLAFTEKDAQGIAQMGLRVIRRQLTDAIKPSIHDIKALAAVFKEVMDGCPLPPR